MTLLAGQIQSKIIKEKNKEIDKANSSQSAKVSTIIMNFIQIIFLD
jgi:hypothetical protein